VAVVGTRRPAKHDAPVVFNILVKGLARDTLPLWHGCGDTTCSTIAMPTEFGESGRSAGGVLRNMEAMTAQMQAARINCVAGSLATSVPTGAVQSGGVWISQELWRAIRRQLESKVQEMNALVEEHQRVKGDLTESLNKAVMRNGQLEGLSKDLELVRQRLREPPASPARGLLRCAALVHEEHCVHEEDHPALSVQEVPQHTLF
jgi:hypothetical protein